MDPEETTLAAFCEALGSKAPTPGGGGASALAGALAASLGAMVGNLTVGKKKYADAEREMLVLIERADALRRRLLAMIREDAEAFEPLSRAYSLPKDAPDRDDILEACLRRAADAPLRILRLCCEVVALQERFAEKGSVMVASDAATGAALARGAMFGAAINVKVNTKLMKRRDYAEEIDREVDALTEEYRQRADRVYEDVYGRVTVQNPLRWASEQGGCAAQSRPAGEGTIAPR